MFYILISGFKDKIRVSGNNIGVINISEKTMQNLNHFNTESSVGSFFLAFYL